MNNKGTKADLQSRVRLAPRAAQEDAKELRAKLPRATANWEEAMQEGLVT